MKKYIAVSGLVLAMAGGAALAQPAGPHHGGWMLDLREGNGTVTKEQLRQQQAERFQRFDTDGDGRLTAAELDAGIRQERAERMLKWLDKDGDGSVSQEELAAPAERMFERLDANGDGTVSKDELRRKQRGKGPRGPRAED